jgi:hypothetical protein
MKLRAHAPASNFITRSRIGRIRADRSSGGIARAAAIASATAWAS